jgi:hypothetical protein
MPHLHWQKSSFSGGSGSGECLELATSTHGVLLRESEEPTTTLIASPISLAALIDHIKAVDPDNL